MAAAHLTFTSRRSLFEKPTTYTLSEDALTAQEEGKAPVVLPFSQVEGVHLTCTHTKQRVYHECRVIGRGQKVVKFRTPSYSGLAQFDDLRATYVPFVQALHERLRGYPGTIRFRGGSLPTFLLAAGVFGVIAVMAVAALPAGLWFVSLALAFVLWRLWPSIPPSKPREYTPSDIPLILLP